MRRDNRKYIFATTIIQQHLITFKKIFFVILNIFENNNLKVPN